MKSAFIPFDERLAIIDEVIKPRLRRADRLTELPPNVRVGCPTRGVGSGVCAVCSRRPVAPGAA